MQNFFINLFGNLIQMEEGYLLFNMAFIMIFGMLGAFTLFSHATKDEKFRNYKQARKVLGTAFFILSVYCIVRLIYPSPESGHHNDYFCPLVMVSLVFSWLNYSALLLLLNAAAYTRRRFLIDGIIPISLMSLFSLIGHQTIENHKIIEIVIGIIFFAKCLWMFYSCIKEYRKCVNDLENYYDDIVDINWILTLIILTFILSVTTFTAFYIPEIHKVSDFFSLAVYVYMVFKILNYAPKKIEKIREKYTLLEKEEEVSAPKNKKEIKDLNDKIGPIVNNWVEAKKYCIPDLTIKTVATEIGTNQNYLSKYINNVQNMTFSVWLNTLRVEESKRILVEHQKKSIEEVGIEVGIPQIYNFSRWFKQVTGLTPYQYRKNN